MKFKNWIFRRVIRPVFEKEILLEAVHLLGSDAIQGQAAQILLDKSILIINPNKENESVLEKTLEAIHSPDIIETADNQEKFKKWMGV